MIDIVFCEFVLVWLVDNLRVCPECAGSAKWIVNEVATIGMGLKYKQGLLSWQLPILKECYPDGKVFL